MKKLLAYAVTSGSISLVSFLLSPWFPNTAIQIDLYIVGGVSVGIVALMGFCWYIKLLFDLT